MLALGTLVAGCGGDDDGDGGDGSGPSGTELAAAWDTEAEAAYAAADKDRDEDFAVGALVEGCFFLDAEGADVIAAALGNDGEVEISDQNFLSGPPGEEERMVCGLSDPSGSEPEDRAIGSVGAGTTLATAEQFRERLLRQAGATELEGTPDGLDPEDVAAVERQGVNSFVWISEDFTVGVSAPAQIISAAEGFEALPTVVDEVSRTLLD